MNRIPGSCSPGWRRVFFLLVAAVLFLGTGTVARPQSPPPAPPGADAPEATGEFEPGEEEDFHYNPAGKRDPFESLLTLQTKVKDISKLPPIQQFDLGGVTIIGVVVDEVEGPRAMIKAPGGHTYVVRVGTVIGKNEGEVIEVSLEGIRVAEKFMDFMNRETIRETFIKSHPR